MQEPLWTRFNTTSPEIQLLNPTSPSRSDTPTLARDGFASIPVGAGILHKPSKALYIAAAPEGAPQDKADPQSIGLEPTFVRLEQVRPAGRKAMGVWEWYNGLSKEMKASKMLRFEA